MTESPGPGNVLALECKQVCKQFTIGKRVVNALQDVSLKGIYDSLTNGELFADLFTVHHW